MAGEILRSYPPHVGFDGRRGVVHLDEPGEKRPVFRSGGVSLFWFRHNRMEAGVETQHRMAAAVAVRVAPDRVSSGTFLYKMPHEDRCGATVASTSHLCRNEMHRRGIHAITQSRRLRSIIEHVPEMRVA